MTSKKQSVIVIGAGPAGCACAYELSKLDINVHIFEASEHIGGMSRSMELWGQQVDLGPHRFFSKDQQVNAFFDEVVQNDFSKVNRLTRIYYGKKFIQYPLKPLNALRNLPFLKIMGVLIDYAKIKIRPKKDIKTFEDWVISKFGKSLYLLFFKSYTEKLWGIPCSEIDADWASQRIKSLTLFEALKSAFNSNKGNKHTTLIDEFSYPNGGSGTIYRNCVDRIIEGGGNVNLNSPVKRVLMDDLGKVSGVELMDGTKHLSDVVVSTMPMNLLVKGFDKVPEKVLEATSKLRFRNTILVYLEVNASNLFEDNWIYIHEKDVKHGRITNFRNWGSSLQNGKDTTILCMEFWAFDTDDLWNASSEDIKLLASKEVKFIGLVPESIEILNQEVLKLSRSYPIYNTGYKEHLDVVQNYLNGFENLLPIGRYGSFKYNNQDHSILMGLLAAEKIANQKEVNLWDVNTEAEYQETATKK